jgi:hypothetical protein
MDDATSHNIHEPLCGSHLLRLILIEFDARKVSMAKYPSYQVHCHEGDGTLLIQYGLDDSVEFSDWTIDILF